MDCVNHNGVNATAYCQSCGKALCQECVRKGAGGQIFCDPCWRSWQTAQHPYVPPPIGGPSPGLAALLGFIPGVGAMYNGQFIKGMVHVVIFAVIVSAAHVFGIFVLFAFAWTFYQVFEAYQTAKARRDGDPLPDPLGLTELSNSIAGGMRPPQPPPPGAATGAPGANPNVNQASNQAPYQAPYPSGYGDPNMPPIPPVPPVPPIPPVPPVYWRRREPIGAIILIAFGAFFLAGQFDWFSWDVFRYFWPVLLIGLGVWLFVRRLEYSRRISPPNPPAGSENDSQGGQK